LRHAATAPLALIQAASPALYAVAAVGVGGALALAAARAARAPRTVSRAAWGLWAGAVACGALALSLPFGLGATIWLGPRFAIVAALMALAAASPGVARAFWERAVAAATAGCCALALWLGHAGFDRELRPLAQLIEALPVSPRVAGVSFAAECDAVAPFYQRDGQIPFFSLYAHVASYYVVRCGGSTPWMTFHVTLPWIPLGQREPSYRRFGIADPFAPVVQSRRLVANAARIPLVIARVGDERQLAALRGPYVPIMQAGEFWALATDALVGAPTCGGRPTGTNASRASAAEPERSP
jgi:hypothetical protein